MLKRIGAEESGEFKAIASGTLPSGKPVIVNADGTVSVVGPVTRSESVGTRVVFDNGQMDATAVTFDSNSNKVVVVWRDNLNSYYGTAAVGTVNPSDNSITFGSDVVFEAANVRSGFAIAFDSTNNKVVIAYKDGGNSNYGTAIVGTVSGTSISFGTAVVFNSATTSDMSVVDHTTGEKMVISYRDGGNSDTSKSIVGTVSGTSISFGSATAFSSAFGYFSDSAYDSTNNRIVVVWTHINDSSKGKAAVGNLVANQIVFGSEVVFHSNTTGEFNRVGFAPYSGEVVVAVVVKQRARKVKH